MKKIYFHRWPLFQSNLAIALYLLPRKTRKDFLLFYTFCRSVDHIADHSSLSPSEKEEQLTQWLRGIQEAPSPLLPSDFQELLLRRNLDKKLLGAIIRGMQMDLSISRYATFDDLYPYLWRVASAVGLISVQLFGANEEATKKYAKHLGIALQLTNILRDVAEDASMGRIYLPLEDLKRFGVFEEELLESTSSPRATHLFHYEAERAISYFAKAERAWEKISPHEQRLMKPARLMEAIYRTLLQEMQRDCFDLFHRRYRVSKLRKGTLFLHAFFPSLSTDTSDNNLLLFV